jgi:hypothetical protein
MSLQYSGGPYINRTVAIANKQDLVNAITQALFDAGWSTIGGTPGSGNDVIQQSAANNNNGCKCRVRNSTVAPSSTSSFHCLKDPLGVLPDGTGIYCDAAALTWRIVASPYNLFAWKSGSATNAIRSALFFGTLYVPTFLTCRAGAAYSWLVGAGVSDTDAGGRTGWRTQLRGGSGNWAGDAMYDQNWYRDTANYQGIAIFQGGPYSNDSGYLWEDGSPIVYEPLLTAPTGSSAGNEHRIKGQLYDAAIISSNNWAQETILSIDNHNYIVVTVPSQANNAAWASLIAVVP